jgi:isoquinoline 1-oxidoreductase beta subunit
VSTSTWDAWQAANNLKVSWNSPASVATLNDANFVAQAQALIGTGATPYGTIPGNPPGTLYTVEGNAASAASAISSAAKVVDVQYSLPYVAHACMEVLNCTVDYVAGVKCDIYAPTQNGKGVLAIAMQLTGLAASQINVHTTYLGGGLGRKYETDFVSQAIQVGMALQKPVKLMWPRSEDFTHDQYRPMALVHAQAGLNSAGSIVGWAYRNISPSILSQRGAVLGATGDSQGYESSNALPYSLGSFVTEYVSHPSPIPVGFWRSVGASINSFAVECMMDELAAAAGVDPLQFRLNNLTNQRWINVLNAAATLSKWSSKPATGHYRGVAITSAFNSVVAEVVEISNVTATGLRVNTVSVVLDNYLTVNPGQVQAQLMGGVVHGMNAALYGRQSFTNGVPYAKNFNNSRMIKAGEMPQVNMQLMPNPSQADSTIPIGGVGELGVPAFAPALANAYFKATGTRVRKLPFFPNATMSD